jgi:uncharacterized protein YcaQ
LGPLWGSILAQDSPKRSLEAPGRAFWSGKKRKGKVLFSYAKTIVSERRAHQTTMKIAEKVSRSHQKTVEEQEQESIQKGTAFEPVLDAILQEF